MRLFYRIRDFFVRLFEKVTPRRILLYASVLLAVTSLIGIYVYLTQEGENETEYKNLQPKNHATKTFVGELNSENENIIAFIKIDDTRVNYPIVQAQDNSYYVNHNVSGKRRFAGSIFLDCRNKSDFSDRISIIYGHNMRSGSMFGALEKYLDEDFAKSHDKIKITTLSGEYIYRVFSVLLTKADDSIYALGGDPYKSQLAIEQMKKNSVISTSTKPKMTKKVVVLSTCAKGKVYDRIIICAELEEEI